MSARRVGAAAPPRSSAQHAGVYFEVMVSEADARRRGEEPSVQVRCLCCHRRRFDVSEVRYFDPEYGMLADGSLTVERKCPGCGREHRGLVTASPGDPWVGSSGLDGPWRCACGRSLGHVDPVRGRVKTTCGRCRAEGRTVAAGAIAVASVPTRPVPDVPEVGPHDDPFDEVPF